MYRLTWVNTVNRISLIQTQNCVSVHRSARVEVVDEPFRSRESHLGAENYSKRLRFLTISKLTKNLNLSHPTSNNTFFNFI